MSFLDHSFVRGTEAIFTYFWLKNPSLGEWTG
jgi:hypothetical protein